MRLPRPVIRLLPGSLAAVLVAWVVWTFMTTTRPGTPHLFDFHTFWAAGRAYAHGLSPYPAKLAGPITRASWFVYPAPNAAVFAPLGVLPYTIAAAIFGALLVVAAAASLWFVGVRDWRCYAIAFCSLPLLKAMNLGTVTPLLMLGVALAWRLRTRDVALACVVGATVLLKLFLWPLLPWLWFTGRRRAAIGSLVFATAWTFVAWLPLGLASATHYPTLLHQLSLAEATAGYGASGVLSALGVSAHVAVIVPLLLAPPAIHVIRRFSLRLDERSSLALTVGIAVAISPIVWEHYFALAITCVALASSSFSAAWLLPLAYWALPDQHAWGSLWRCGLALVLLAGCAAGLPRSAALRFGRLGRRFAET